MRIVTYNIQAGMGRDGVVDMGRIARTVSGADVICLQEVERNWSDGDHPDQPAHIAALLPEHHALFAPAIDLHDARPGAAKGARRQFGLLILSRWPILTSRVFPLPKYPVHGQPNGDTCLQEAVIAPGGRGLRLYNTHLNHLSPRQRRLQLAEVQRHIDEAPRQGAPLTGGIESGDSSLGVLPGDTEAMPAPAILLGDFNLRPTDSEYDMLVGERDSYHGRLVEAGLFADALALSGLGDAEGVTYPDPYPDGVQRIDHIFLSHDLVPAFRRAWIDGAAEGSDHQPVFAEIDLP